MNLFWAFLIFIKCGISYLFIGEEAIITMCHELARINVFYVKFFQAISTNKDLLSPHLKKQLTEYTDNVPYHSNDLDYSFIGHLEENNIYLDDEYPINSGVISLVYTATNSHTQKRYVVKTKRRDIENKLANSIKEIRFIIFILSYLPYLKDLNISDVFEENADSIQEQVDFVKECENTLTMGNLNKKIDYIVIPQIYPEYTRENPDILVMDYLEGKRLCDVLPEENDKYCEILAKFSIKCIFFDGIFHGDMHQGNLIFMKEDDTYRVGAIDFGIMGKLTRNEQDKFYQFMEYLNQNEIYKCAELLLFHITEPQDIVNTMDSFFRDALIKDIAALINQAMVVHHQITPHDIYLISRLLKRYGLKIARFFCKVQLAYVINEGVCKSLSKDKPFILWFKEILQNNFIKY